MRQYSSCWGQKCSWLYFNGSYCPASTCIRSPLRHAMRPIITRSEQSIAAITLIYHLRQHQISSNRFIVLPTPIAVFFFFMSPLRHFHRTRLAAFQLAELAFVDEPVRAGIAHAAGPNQNIRLGFDDRKRMTASHAWHRVRVRRTRLW